MFYWFSPFTGTPPPTEYDAHLLNHAHLFLCQLQSAVPSGCLLLSFSMCMCLYQSVTPISIFYCALPLTVFFPILFPASFCCYYSCVF